VWVGGGEGASGVANPVSSLPPPIYYLIYADITLQHSAVMHLFYKWEYPTNERITLQHTLQHPLQHTLQHTAAAGKTATHCSGASATYCKRC